MPPAILESLTAAAFFRCGCLLPEESLLASSSRHSSMRYFCVSVAAASATVFRSVVNRTWSDNGCAGIEWGWGTNAWEGWVEASNIPACVADYSKGVELSNERRCIAGRCCWARDDSHSLVDCISHESSFRFSPGIALWDRSNDKQTPRESVMTPTALCVDDKQGAFSTTHAHDEQVKYAGHDYHRSIGSKSIRFVARVVLYYK